MLMIFGGGDTRVRSRHKLGGGGGPGDDTGGFVRTESNLSLLCLSTGAPQHLMKQQEGLTTYQCQTIGLASLHNMSQIFTNLLTGTEHGGLMHVEPTLFH